MKITYRSKVIALLLFLTAISPALAVTTPSKTTENTEARALALQSRLSEIKALDDTSLSKAEKKALRREVKEIKKEMAALSGGVYLSVGAILLIALLLILLL